MGEGVKNFQKLIRPIYITVLYSYWIYLYMSDECTVIWNGLKSKSGKIRFVFLLRQ